MSKPHSGRSLKRLPLAQSVRTLLMTSCLNAPYALGMQVVPSDGATLFERTVWADVAARHGLDPYLLYAVALVESSRIDHGKASPWPWAIHHRGKALYPNTRKEALSYIRHQILAGENTLDVGLMQVNLKWHGHRVASLEALMEPKANLELGARILSESMASVPGDRTLGIGRYHAWQDFKEALRYGRKVIRVADALKTLNPVELKETP